MNIGDMGVPFIYQGEELIYPEYVKDGLVLHYDFSGMTNNDASKGIARDLSGNGNHGTLQNFNYTPESGYDKNKLLFDGVDDSLTIPELTLDETAMSVVHNGNIYVYDDDKVIKVKEYSEDSSSEFEGLEIGGRNLALKTAEPQERTITNVRLRYDLNNESLRNNIGKDITISFEAKFDSNKNFNAYISQLPSDYVLNSTSISGGTKNWEKFSLTGVIGSKAEFTTNAQFTLATTNYGAIRNLKVELGNKATDWTPAPEDFQTTSLSPPSLSNLQLYNRPLTPEEIAHNYAIEKERFGIE